MATMSRRDFLDQSKRTTLGMAAGVTILGSAQSVFAAPANERVVLAVVGINGRGGNLAANFSKRDDCRVGYLCDVNSALFEPRSKTVAEGQGAAPKCETDFRRALDDKSVDAVVIATPDHWHALATVWACQAGKDVYVEKPLSHSAWEGQQMIAAAKKHNRIVQVGTQSRSAAYAMEARKYIAEGKLGKIHFCRVYNQKTWPNFPPQPDGDVPAGLDWDMWNGPAPLAPYNRNLHRAWNHFWRYSSGDIINDGIHQLDLARYALGVGLPRQVYSTGQRFEPGAAESPDVQMAVYDFDDMVVSFELTLYTPYMLKIAPVIRDSLTEYPYWPQCATRIEIYGSEGLMYLARHGGGWQVFGRPHRETPVLKDECNGGFPDPEHQDNFLHCIRTRERPNAPIEEGHISTLWAHYATMSYRLGGQKLTVDPATEHVDNAEAMKSFKREYRKPWVLEQV
jgi:predicted dehydrogenase